MDQYLNTLLFPNKHHPEFCYPDRDIIFLKLIRTDDMFSHYFLPDLQNLQDDP